MTARGDYLFVLAHGAGAASSSAWMQRFRRHFEGLGRVHLFDYPYAQRGRRTPDRLPVLIDAHVAELEAARRERHGPVVLVGKSMGGRVGCHVSLSRSVDAVICLGYPLVGAGKRPKLRDEVLLQMRTPVLFVQGTRDALCPLELLEATRARMRATSALHVVPGGNHSLEATKTSLRQAGSTQATLEAEVMAAVQRFLRDT